MTQKRGGPPHPSLKSPPKNGFQGGGVGGGGGGAPKGSRVYNLLMQFSSLSSSKMEISETDFFDTLTIQNDQISFVKHVLAPLYVLFTEFGWGGRGLPRGLGHNLLMQFYSAKMAVPLPSSRCLAEGNRIFSAPNFAIPNFARAPPGSHHHRFGGALCAVRKVGCVPPPVGTDPRVLNSAPFSPCWYTRVFFFSLMLATGPRVLNSAPQAVLN